MCKGSADEEEVVKPPIWSWKSDRTLMFPRIFTNLEIKDESKVKVTFQKAENDAGENFSTSHADTYHAVFIMWEPVNQKSTRFIRLGET